MERDRGALLSRRALIAGTLGASGAALALAAPAAATSSDPATLLSDALQFERLSVLAYRRVLALPGLPGSARHLLRQLLVHERAHVRVLEQELAALGRALPPAPSRYDQVDQALSEHGMSGNLAGLSTLKDSVQLLLDIEALCEGAYYVAIGKLTALGPLERAMQALASEAQHSVLLGELLYPGDVQRAAPDWFVAGVT